MHAERLCEHHRAGREAVGGCGRLTPGLNRRAFLRCVAASAAGLCGLRRAAAEPAGEGNPPNIVVILTDDQGYADISLNPDHPKEVATPNMDALAGEGVCFTQAYITGNVCSPTRAGIMTGRYQQRYGIYTAGEGGSGLALEAKTFPQFLKPAGYVCGAFGKWHLGLTREYSPLARGFDEFYGFLGRGAHDYFDLDNADSPLYRGFEPIEDEGYLTTRLTDEAVSFIRQHKAQPFFVYLAYNAVHAPPQAPKDDVKRFNTGDPHRDVLMAMLTHLDAGVGRVARTLKDEGVWENTLLFFLTDNGGSKAMHAVNTPLRGFKQWNYEGGIRTPFIVAWPARLKGGGRIDTPVISLDILPTALAAAGVHPPTRNPFDGKSLLPVLRGETKTVHEHLFWSEGGASGEWAVRSGNWKLVGIRQNVELFDLSADPGEQHDLAARYPDQVKRLSALYNQWLDQMAEPMKSGGKRWKPSTPTPDEARRLERRKARNAQKHRQRVELPE